MESRRFYHWNICKIYDKGGTDGDAGGIAGIFGEVRIEGCHASTLRAPCSFCFCLQRRAFVNEERGIPGRPKVPVLTSHAGLNSRSCTALSLIDGRETRVRVQLPAANEFDRSFPSVDDERSIKIKQKYIPGLEQLATYIEAFQFPAFVSTYLQICAGTGNLINSSKIESLQKSEIKNDEKKEIAYSLMVDLLLAKNLD